MELRLPLELAARYKSGAQRARVVTEAWAEANLYCPNCSSLRLTPAAHNTEAIDFNCPDCDSPFQLKSQSRRYTHRIPDAAYSAMRRAIIRGRTPNLFALHYDLEQWKVRTVFLIPRFVFSLSAVIVRKPLSPAARRRGWVGCDISLDRIPPEVRISIIMDGIATTPESVRRSYKRLAPLARLKHDERGWRLDVLNVVQSLGKEEFMLDEVYAYADELRRLHPGNRFVEAKIRQQLQQLRDMGFLQFVRRGRYRLKR